MTQPHRHTHFLEREWNRHFLDVHDCKYSVGQDISYYLSYQDLDTDMPFEKPRSGYGGEMTGIKKCNYIFIIWKKNIENSDLLQ